MSVSIPLQLLREAEGLVVRCTTSSGDVYRGVLVEVYHNMNLRLKNTKITYSDGKVLEVDYVFVKGFRVLYVALPNVLRNSHLLNRANIPEIEIDVRSHMMNIRADREQGQGEPAPYHAGSSNDSTDKENLEPFSRTLVSPGKKAKNRDPWWRAKLTSQAGSNPAGEGPSQSLNEAVVIRGKKAKNQDSWCLARTSSQTGSKKYPRKELAETSGQSGLNKDPKGKKKMSVEKIDKDRSCDKPSAWWRARKSSPAGSNTYSTGKGPTETMKQVLAIEKKPVKGRGRGIPSGCSPTMLTSEENPPAKSPIKILRRDGPSKDTTVQQRAQAHAASSTPTCQWRIESSSSVGRAEASGEGSSSSNTKIQMRKKTAKGQGRGMSSVWCPVKISSEAKLEEKPINILRRGESLKDFKVKQAARKQADSSTPTCPWRIESLSSAERNADTAAHSRPRVLWSPRTSRVQDSSRNAESQKRRPGTYSPWCRAKKYNQAGPNRAKILSEAEQTDGEQAGSSTGTRPKTAPPTGLVRNVSLSPTIQMRRLSLGSSDASTEDDSNRNPAAQRRGRRYSTTWWRLRAPKQASSNYDTR